MKTALKACIATIIATLHFSSNAFADKPCLETTVNRKNPRATSNHVVDFLKVRKMTISSTDFSRNGTISEWNSCFDYGAQFPGDGLSPALSWKNIPQKTSRLALLVHDKDADFIHWFMLIEKKNPWFKAGVPDSVPKGQVAFSYQGANDFGIVGYSGPCPPRGETHRYTFELFALSAGAKGSYFGDSAAAIKRKLKKDTLATASMTGFFTAPSQVVVPTPAATAVPTPPPPSGTITDRTICLDSGYGWSCSGGACSCVPRPPFSCTTERLCQINGYNWICSGVACTCTPPPPGSYTERNGCLAAGYSWFCSGGSCSCTK
jgi:Raf kinase inhibitor-like YbhB/YbcL family protein